MRERAEAKKKAADEKAQRDGGAQGAAEEEKGVVNFGALGRKKTIAKKI